ncbi:hypothetical protein ACWOAQ_06325 [Helcococcus kunzii]|uniref:Uncharacterized protein n=1 Tax=Helcococcus kunzii ATCC 51366 TaxID=883114 RepID=H3NPS5_9FIRM|nr:hypothetical protein [Helcococcus kunzii]EHR33303.1 hypothetical protein HMPREF9709_01347 [Helcococcus kunzii ATCC 51366]
MGILKQVYKSNRLVRVIIFVQIIFSLLMSITFYNRYKTVNKLSAELWNTPLRHSIVFMGKQVGVHTLENVAEEAGKDFIKEKEKIYEYCRNHPETFIGMTPIYLHESFKYGENDDIAVDILDSLTIKIVEPHFEGKYNLETTGNKIPVVVQSNLKNKFKKGDVIATKKSGETFNFIIEGYYDDETHLMDGAIFTAEGNFTWESVFNKVYPDYPKFIALENEIFNKIHEKPNYESIEYNQSQSILYLNEKATEKDLEKFDKFVNDNKLGYYGTSEEIFAVQNISLESMFNSRFDLILSFIVILILTIISIGYVNKDKLENRYKIYYLNGLSLKKMYIITAGYYMLLFILPFIFYTILFRILDIDFIEYNYVVHMPIFDRLIMDDNNLHFDEILVLSAIFMLIISTISYWPVKNIRNKYSRQRYGVKK